MFIIIIFLSNVIAQKIKIPRKTNYWLPLKKKKLLCILLRMKLSFKSIQDINTSYKTRTIILISESIDINGFVISIHVFDLTNGTADKGLI